MNEPESDAENTEAAMEAAPSAEADKKPFALAVKNRVQSGAKLGRVKILRGGGTEPYEVQIVWDEMKYPEWIQYATLKLRYDAGEFKIL